MSDEKIDHAAEARRIAAMTADKAALMEAQVHATLALVEQQRIANLIALGHKYFGDEYDRETYAALLHPEIRKGLGL